MNKFPPQSCFSEIGEVMNEMFTYKYLAVKQKPDQPDFKKPTIQNSRFSDHLLTYNPAVINWSLASSNVSVVAGSLSIG